jgi:predicted kinase
MAYLIILAGLIGSGKSKVADIMKDDLCAAVLRTDTIFRDEIRGYKNKQNYQDDAEIIRLKDETYAKMFEKAKVLLDKSNVILDATFSLKSWRDEARNLAMIKNAGYYMIEVICRDEKTLKERLDKRGEENIEAAPYSVHKGQVGKFDLIDDSEKDFTIDNSTSEESLERQIEEIVRAIKDENRLS